jgi:hypothetical protein
VAHAADTFRRVLNAKVIPACDALAADQSAVWSRAMRAKSVIGAGSLDPFPRCLAALFDLRSDRVGHVAAVTVRRDRTEVAAAGGGKGVNHLTVTPVVRGRVSVWAAARRSVDPLPVCRRHQFADIWHASMLLAVLTGRIGKIRPYVAHSRLRCSSSCFSSSEILSAAASCSGVAGGAPRVALATRGRCPPRR